MTRQRPFPRFSSPVLLMFVTFAVQGFASPRLSDPCDRIRSDFDAQIKDLKQQQKLELQSCRTGGSDQCSSLKAQQKEELRQLTRERDYQLRGCQRVPLARGIPLANTTECYTARQEYVNNYYDRNPGDNDHYPPPAPGKHGPGKVVGGGNSDGNHPGHRLPRDSGGAAGEPPTTYSPRDGSSASSSSGHNAGSSHNAGGGHNAGSGHNAGGGSSTSASSGHSSGGGSSYSGGSSSGGGGSSSGSSHSSGGGSSSSGGGYSGGGSSSGGGGSSGGGSSASSSSTPSHDSGAARPK
jgi:hypothetical protein